jgi:hypothetical protein
MPTTQDLIDQVRQAFIDTGGLLPREDMYSRFVNESNALGIEEQVFYTQVLKPATKGLNLTDIEDRYREKQAALAKLQQEAKQKEAVQKISEWLYTAFTYNTVKASHLAQLFSIAEAAELDTGKLAETIADRITHYQYQPVLYIDTNTKMPLKEILLFTDWQQAPPAQTPSTQGSRPSTSPSNRIEAPKADKKVLIVTAIVLVLIILLLRAT